MSGTSLLSGPLWSLSFQTTPDAEEFVSERLTAFSGQPVVVTHSLVTGLTTVAVYLRDGAFWTPARRRELLAELAPLGKQSLRVARLRWKPVPPEDWQESWKRHFPPLVVGRRLLVRPSWSSRRPGRGQEEIVLDPGLSFGTGQHPTTAFCLAEVVRLAPKKEPRSLLDVGTGSGILAIAAARLGYAPVEAYDSDPDAIAVARRNAVTNGVGDHIRWVRRNLESAPTRRRFDVVCSNLTSDLLVRHAASLLAGVRPGGFIVLAGILAEEFETVRARYESLGGRMERGRRRREWHSATFSTRPCS